MTGGDRPLVSVVMTVYNGARYVTEAVESVLAQSYPAIELVVLDDGSTDETVERLAPYDRIKLIRSDHIGMGAARNRALRHVTGDLLTFLDADDRYPEERIAVQVAALEADPNLDLVYGHVREFVSPDLDPDAAARLRAPASLIPGRLPHSMLIRGPSFFRVGPFAEHLRVGIGLDWSARAAETDLRWVMLDEVVLHRRLHGDNNALRQRSQRDDYLFVVKAAVDRRRASTPRD